MPMLPAKVRRVMLPGAREPRARLNNGQATSAGTVGYRIWQGRTVARMNSAVLHRSNRQGGTPLTIRSWVRTRALT
jgi:hypothetical protein